MYNVNPEAWRATVYVASLMSLMLVLQPGEPVELARIDGVAMVTGRILNVPDHSIGQPLPMTENMAAVETNYSVA